VVAVIRLQRVRRRAVGIGSTWGAHHPAVGTPAGKECGPQASLVVKDHCLTEEVTVNCKLLIAGAALVALVVVAVLLAPTLGGGGSGGLGY
jgi:hypothetical protein